MKNAIIEYLETEFNFYIDFENKTNINNVYFVIGNLRKNSFVVNLSKIECGLFCSDYVNWLIIEL